jgi:hypothetical protein
MESYYLTTLPKVVVRALAGFNVVGGQFILPRAECEVPEELARSVFPAIEGVQSQLDEGEKLTLDAFMKDVKSYGPGAFF